MFLIPLSYQLTLRDSGAAPPFEYKKGCSDKMISLFDDKRPKLNKKALRRPLFPLTSQCRAEALSWILI